jgi:hypothetical protein
MQWQLICGLVLCACIGVASFLAGKRTSTTDSQLGAEPTTPGVLEALLFLRQRNEQLANDLVDTREALDLACSATETMFAEAAWLGVLVAATELGEPDILHGVQLVAMADALELPIETAFEFLDRIVQEA